MNKKFKFVIILSAIFLFGFANKVHASLNIDITVDVPKSCTATDTDGVVHSYGDSYLAICAFEKALSNGSISNIQLSNQYPSMGLFITSINNVTADPNSQYWALYQNGNYASSGVTQLPVATGDILMFQLHDFSDNNTGDQATLHINSLIPEATGSLPLLADTGTPVNTENIIPVKKTFDINKAEEFLNKQQNNNGSFGENIYTDWTALALATRNNQDKTIKLIKYFGENKINGNLITDHERHTIALMALGLNPYNTNGENYIEKIISSFDGKQFGDTSEDNDDIFALIVLQNAGYTQEDKIMADDISFLLNRQIENGSWDNSIDMTGAAIEALSTFSPTPLVRESLEKAKNFLKENQKDDGSWGNPSSTAWALEGILALGEKPEDWIKNSNNPLDYFATIQDIDGGTKNENLNNKIWETSYIISALSSKTWNQIMQKFDKQEIIKIVELKQENKELSVSPKINENKNKLTKARIEKLAKENIANAINSTFSTPPETTEIKESDKGWFTNLIERIFNLF